MSKELDAEIKELLKEIRDNTKPKAGFDVILSGKDTSLTSTFTPSIEIKGNWVLALESISTYNSIPNVTPDNNVFRYNNGTNWKSLTLGTGSYEIEQLNAEISRLMRINNDYDTVNDMSYITIEANVSRLTSIITLSNNYQVDFSVSNSIGPLLGFSNTVTISNAYNESPSPVDIISVNSILVHCNVTRSFYLNGKQSNSIYSVPINVSPGFRLISHPNTLQYHKIVLDRLDQIRVWLTDDTGKPLNLRGELVTIRLRIQEI